jgi:putative ABC transport system permease protein
MRWPWNRYDADDHALDDEIRAHFAMAVADRIGRGESPDDALAAARREFGNVAHVKEVTREMWGGMWLERLAQDLRYAIRSLRRAPTFAAVAIATVALGIGANTAMFTIIRGVLLRPLAFPDPGALFLVSHVPDQAKSFAGPSMVDREYVDYRRLTRSFAATTSYTQYPATLLGAAEPLRLATAGVTPSFFSTLGVPAQLGRVFRKGEDAPGANAVAIIAARLWRERFGGDTATIGRSVTIEGYRKTIVGVMPDGFEFPRHTQVWVPMAIDPGPRNARLSPVIGRLARGATTVGALAELRTFVANEERDLDANRTERATTEIIPLRDAIVGDVRGTLLLFGGAVAIVLLIACANVSNLMLLRTLTRRHELGIRAALGASRPRLMRQLLTESLVVALAGSLLGLLIARAAVALLLAAAPADLLPRESEIHIDLAVLGVMLVSCVAVAGVTAMAPMLRAAHHDVRDALTDAGRTTSRGRLRGAFVTAEMAMALALLIGAGLLLRSLQKLTSVDPGFTPDHLVTGTVDLPITRYQTPELLHDVQRHLSARIAAIRGVRSAAAVNWIPLSMDMTMGDFALDDGRPLPPDYNVLKPCVTPEYFSTMGIRIRQGRGFLASDDAASGRVVVISRGVAQRFWPTASAIGKRITMSDKPQPRDWMTIVGVVDDVVQTGLADPRAEAIYLPLAQVEQPFWLNHLVFVARVDDAAVATVAVAMRAAIRAVDPDQPIESIMTMDTRISGIIAEPRFRSMLVLVFSGLALTLAAIGIYGVLAYGVTERARELGIRLALGAAPRDIVGLVLAGSARLAIPGLVIGLAAALAGARVLTAFLFQVRSTDPVTFIGATVVLLTVALGAGYLPARRAARIDPVLTIK